MTQWYVTSKVIYLVADTWWVPKNWPVGVLPSYAFTSLSGYSLLNASRTTGNDFENFESEHTFARKRTVFAFPQLLRNWGEQRPRTEGSLDSGDTGELGRVSYGSGLASDFIFIPSYLIVVGLHLIRCTLYYVRFQYVRACMLMWKVVCVHVYAEAYCRREWRDVLHYEVN
jgi:hypothetical protein